MNKIINIISLLALVIVATFTYAQNSPNESILYKFEDEVPTDIKNVKSFTYTVIDKKIFFKLVVNKLNEDCVFVIERSESNNDFSPIAMKMGKADTNNINLLYCFSDTLNFESEKAYYRLKQVFETSGVYLSDIHVVENEPYYYLADYKK
ncbi:MAG TPA: hypothetical protein DDX39_09670 [Bacteroidales bacterium]|nr:MAG: hypothetical protein A2W98_01705 [Bacteroidetes bacterium GWF2_33_38]OFY74348.1 MAG: hypothetical protein A2265_06235 [Bacteroidetes bacterium RIFOXYA12_FULL_33_9]OFY84731.1 MAG: hypothetical protein A2236_04965 [Bacteroidetes bacterium RIFOXYA2_FULL_33_7]HBF88896.1 hypothetical protein [Bacteroidales bacterium]